jgi:hypothetical protein
MHERLSSSVDYPDPNTCFDGLPDESGYYWVSGIGPFRVPLIVYIDVSDEDAGGVVVRLPNGDCVASGAEGLAGVQWRGPVPEASFSTEGKAPESSVAAAGEIPNLWPSDIVAPSKLVGFCRERRVEALHAAWSLRTIPELCGRYRAEAREWKARGLHWAAKAQA